MTRTDSATGAAVQAAAESGFRRRLLDGMAAAVRERGYRDATVADVVRHARTSRRTFYEHFAGKQDCFIALLTERNATVIEQIAAAVDTEAPWQVQIRQAVEAWIGASQIDPTITLAWIRETPALGESAQRLHRETANAFIALIQSLTGSAGFAAAGLRPPSRRLATILYGGFRELIATTVEDGGDIDDIVEVAVAAAVALLGPHD
ncbi:TetR/AcrR family transcriptional regulator [Nocardia farcinica]|uniref:Transcriptional repressor BetI n=1 Tax=Nocardia farcinica TaxID=37329 RepID=A0A0H5NM80_NOCFR|nr:TetR/AcrR family transcriptional regulator [Nocardia farcinica]AXK85261.1 TetR/AcrR family transcriptional regulator [Nocardia farcinica]MBA4858675.1 TetR/AcrR family transcriptional regulator [Nocardia farcinica]MBC9817967.1 TetR/AcrR family transcriptional regulator [Nocardia farcinica]MBF6067966.1 TetR/AcrR family transcriptional regulator [Nocardia farcinica]MBF6140162.1 TetR/AcrR family transcriptional regulator [Nocardia farcinica]